MDDILRGAAAERGGYFFRHDLLDLGLTDRDIAAARRADLIVRLRHGTYAMADDDRIRTPEGRHLLKAYSIVDKLDGVVLSHQTAAIAHAGTAWGVDLENIHVTRLDGRGGRTEAGVTFHVGSVVPDGDVRLCDGRPVVVPERAVVEACSLSSVESGMVTVSFAIRSGACSARAIFERLDRHIRWPGMRHVRLAVARAEPACESVGEVRSLYMMGVNGIPRPECQVEVAQDGRLIARNDFGWWTWRHVGEFDGLVKYGRLNPYSELEVGQVLVDEKRREDLVREQMLGMSRWTWSELDRRAHRATCGRIKAGMERSRRLYLRDATHIDLG